MRDYTKGITFALQALTWMIIGTIFGFWLGLKSPEPIQAQPTHTMYDVVLECQKMAAMTNNSAWKYKDCLDELKKSTENVRYL